MIAAIEPDRSSPVEMPNRSRIKVSMRIVEGGKRDEHADAKHRAGDCIAHAGQADHLAGQPAGRHPVRVAEDQAQADGNRRGGGGKHQRVRGGLEEG